MPLGVANMVSNICRVPMVFHRDQVDLEVVEELEIPYTSTGEYLTLMHKGILDSGSESTIDETSRFGWVVSDNGRRTTLSCVLDSGKKYQEREVNAYFKNDGPWEVLFVEQQCKPDNYNIMMKILRRIVKIEQDKYQDYNLDDSFLDRPLDIIVDIKNC